MKNPRPEAIFIRIEDKDLRRRLDRAVKDHGRPWTRSSLARDLISRGLDRAYAKINIK